MILLIKYQKLFIKNFVFLLFLLFPKVSSASAWLIAPDETQVIVSYYQITYGKYFNVNGNQESQSALVKNEVKPYIERGINEDFSVGFSPSFQVVSTESDSNSALAYIDIFLKYKIFEGDFDVFSYEQKIELSGIYDERATPALGKKEPFASFRLLYGDSFYQSEGGDRKAFFDFGLGIKTKFKELTGNDSGAMLEGDLTLGFSFGKNYEIFFQPSFKKALSTYKNQLNILDKYGYDIYKLELSFIRHFSSYDVQVGFSKDVKGKNTGAGDGFLISLIKNF